MARVVLTLPLLLLVMIVVLMISGRRESDAR